ncbi:hypothetical protein FOA52_009430 [Chlamydomonas sp. UWO 241]|nr:hypothetical protein FOA52_009430 [Chlamydomonas sp. UWO 241]
MEGKDSRGGEEQHTLEHPSNTSSYDLVAALGGGTEQAGGQGGGTAAKRQPRQVASRFMQAAATLKGDVAGLSDQGGAAFQRRLSLPRPMPASAAGKGALTGRSAMSMGSGGPLHALLPAVPAAAGTAREPQQQQQEQQEPTQQHATPAPAAAAPAPPDAFATPLVAPRTLQFTETSTPAVPASATGSGWPGVQQQGPAGLSKSTPSAVLMSGAKQAHNQATIDRRALLARYRDDKEQRRQSIGGGGSILASSGGTGSMGPPPSRRESMPGRPAAGGMPPPVPRPRPGSDSGNVPLTASAGPMAQPMPPRHRTISGGGAGPPRVPPLPLRATIGEDSAAATGPEALAASPLRGGAGAAPVRSPLRAASPRGGGGSWQPPPALASSVAASPHVSSDTHTSAVGGRAGGPAVVSVDHRSQLKALRIQELQLRFVNARMEASLAVRSAKAERLLAACAISIGQLHDALSLGESLRARSELSGRVAQACAGVGPLLQQWGQVARAHAGDAGHVARALTDALTAVPLTGGATCGGPATAQPPVWQGGVSQGEAAAEAAAAEDASRVAQLQAALERAASALSALHPCSSALLPPPPTTAAGVAASGSVEGGAGEQLPTAVLLTQLAGVVREEVVALGRVGSALRQLRDKHALVGSYQAQACGM